MEKEAQPHEGGILSPWRWNPDLMIVEIHLHGGGILSPLVFLNLMVSCLHGGGISSLCWWNPGLMDVESHLHGAGISPPLWWNLGLMEMELGVQHSGISTSWRWNPGVLSTILGVPFIWRTPWPCLGSDVNRELLDPAQITCILDLLYEPGQDFKDMIFFSGSCWGRYPWLLLSFLQNTQNILHVEGPPSHSHESSWPATL